MELRQLRYVVVAVAEHQHFWRAHHDLDVATQTRTRRLAGMLARAAWPHILS